MRKLVVAAVAFLAAVPSFAKVVTFEYTGVFNNITEYVDRERQVASTSELPGSVKIGDAFHGRFSYETSTPKWQVGSDTVSYVDWGRDYKVPVSTLTVDRSGTTIVSDTSAPWIYVTKASDYSSLSVALQPISSGTTGIYYDLAFNFYDNRPGTLHSVSIPYNVNLDDFSNPTVSLWWAVGNGYVQTQGLMTSLTNVSPVPEPETYMFWIAGAALAGANSLRKRYRRRAA